MIARELWPIGFRHLSCFTKPAATPDQLAHLRNTLGPDALRAESFYVHEDGRCYGCDSTFTESNAKVWPVESVAAVESTRVVTVSDRVLDDVVNLTQPATA